MSAWARARMHNAWLGARSSAPYSFLYLFLVKKFPNLSLRSKLNSRCLHWAQEIKIEIKFVDYKSYFVLSIQAHNEK